MEGPFSKLNICAVHLGSVTSNTVAAWTREVSRGGGKVATAYSSGETTHIVADASLSWDQLDRYGGWELPWHVGMEEGPGGMPVGVPLVGRDWMVECLKRSAVVAADAHRLTRPLKEAAPSRLVDTTTAAAAAMLCLPDAAGGSGAGDVEKARAIAALPRGSGEPRLVATSSASVDPGKCQPPGSMRVAMMVAAGATAGARVGAEAGAGAAGEEKDADNATLGSRAERGGFGCANPDVADQRSKFFCQSGSSRGHVSKPLCINTPQLRSNFSSKLISASLVLFLLGYV